MKFIIWWALFSFGLWIGHQIFPESTIFEGGLGSTIAVSALAFFACAVNCAIEEIRNGD